MGGRLFEAVAQFFELFFGEEVVRKFEHRAFFFIDVLLHQVLEHVEFGFVLLLMRIHAFEAFYRRLNKAMLFVRLGDFHALLALFCAPFEFGIEDVFFDQRVHAQRAIDLLERVVPFYRVVRFDRFFEERLDLAVLMFEKIESVHAATSAAMRIPTPRALLKRAAGGLLGFAAAGKKGHMQENTPSARVRAEEIDTNTMPVLDARTHPGKEQIRGALRYDPKALMAEEHLTLPLPHEQRIVVYADNEQRAEEIAQRLRDQGYADAAVLDGGFDAYRQAGLPTEEITQEQPVPGEQSAGIRRI